MKLKNTVSNFKLIFRALRHRNYRLYVIGQSISFTGAWMQQVAMSWFIYRITGSPFLLGVVGFAGMIPTFIFSPFAGVFSDRHNRRSMLIITQTLFFVQAVILAALFLTNRIEIWHIVTLSVFMGIVNSFDIPIRQAFTVEMIENRSDLANAIALNSSMLNATRLIGPAIAGLLIVLVGEGICFLLNAISYLPVIASLAAMRLAPHKIHVKHRYILHELKEGFSYVYYFLPMKWILMLISLISLMGVSFGVLMPVFARDIFHGGPDVLGFLVSMAGFGALVGSLYLAAHKTVIGLDRNIAWAVGVFGAGAAIFAVSQTFWFSMVMSFVAGFGMIVGIASSNTILQTISDEDKRGRVMSFYTMAIMGAAPFGCLLAGGLASKIGAPYTLLLSGVCCVIGAAVFSVKLPTIRAVVRPIYAKKGIIPEVAKGMQSAAGLESLVRD
jgi:MFS family permease